MAAPVFRHLSVNSTEPTAADLALYSTWMSVNGTGNLAPTAVRQDSFTLQPAPAVSPAGAAYIRLHTAWQAALQRFDVERAGWTSATPYGHIVSVTARLIETGEEDNRELLAARWGRQLSGLVRASAHANTELMLRARPPALLTAATLADWNARLAEASARAARAGGGLRLALGLPGLGAAAQSEQRQSAARPATAP